MIIRRANPVDAEQIASCFLYAMEDIVYKFIGEQSYEKAFDFMYYFVRSENNQYSWQNCWVAENEKQIVAAVNLYDGAQLFALRKPVIDHLKQKFNTDPDPEDETQAGEYYIDSLGVIPAYRCKGIATKLLQILVEHYVAKQHHTLGLLVDEGNVNAKRLYFKIGFELVGKKTLLGKQLDHLQIAYRK